MCSLQKKRTYWHGGPTGAHPRLSFVGPDSLTLLNQTKKKRNLQISQTVCSVRLMGTSQFLFKISLWDRRGYRWSVTDESGDGINLTGGNFFFVSKEESDSLGLSDRDTAASRPRHWVSQKVIQAEGNELKTFHFIACQLLLITVKPLNRFLCFSWTVFCVENMLLWKKWR